MKPVHRLALFGDESAGLACRAEVIEAVLDHLQLFLLPGIPAGYAGICLFRDEPVPVLSPQILPGELSLEDCCLAICRSELGPVAIPVPAGGKIVEVCEGTLEGTCDSDSPGATDGFIFRNAHYSLLDLERLLLHLQS